MIWIPLFLSLLQSPIFQKSSSSQDRFLYRREAVCFVYHRVGDARFPSTNISTEDFEAHLLFLKQNNYKVMSLSDAVRYVKEPGAHEKVAVITIDDGYESFFKNGLPLLKKHGFPATLAINTETVGAGSYMNWNQLRTCVEAGIEVSNHSHSHPYFLDVDAPERYELLREEIKLSQRMIKDSLGVVPELFVYPYGEFDPKMKVLVKEMGFLAAAAQNSGVVHAQSDFYALPRFPMASIFAAPDKFEAKAKMKALQIALQRPESFVTPGGIQQPSLELVFQKNDLFASSLQCFIQGAECTMEQEEKEGMLHVKIAPATPLNARRTLYTLTIRDEDGAWHWFSHLWINPEKKP